MDDSNNSLKRKDPPKYTQLSLEKKVKIIEDFKKGKKNKDLAKEYSVSHGTITKIIKNKDKYENEMKQIQAMQGHSKHARVTGVLYSAFEKVIFFWFTQKCHLGEPVSGLLLREKALQLHQKMYGETDFKSSDGWLNRFKDRHGIRSLSLKGEILSANSKDAEEFCIWFAAHLQDEEYDLENVFNADETGLYWKSLPQKTHAAKDETSVLGRKISKERVTLLTCANATGTKRIPLLLIGKAKSPRCFKNKTLPLIYDNQHSSWMDKEVFLRWYKTVLLPELKEWKPDPNEKFLLLLDNASSHPSAEELNEIDSSCKIVYLPPNVTSIIQPMDQGCISALKRSYKTSLLHELLAHETTNLCSVTNFIKDWSLLDCCNLIANCWRDVSDATLKHSWKNILKNTPQRNSVARSCEENPSSESHMVEIAQHVLRQKFSVSEIEEWIRDASATPFQVLSENNICNLFTGFPLENDNNVDEESDNDSELPAQDFGVEREDSGPQMSQVLEAAELLCSWAKTQNLPEAIQIASEKMRKIVIDKIVDTHLS